MRAAYGFSNCFCHSMPLFLGIMNYHKQKCKCVCIKCICSLDDLILKNVIFVHFCLLLANTFMGVCTPNKNKTKTKTKHVLCLSQKSSTTLCMKNDKCFVINISLKKLIIVFRWIFLNIVNYSVFNLHRL